MHDLQSVKKCIRFAIHSLEKTDSKFAHLISTLEGSLVVAINGIQFLGGSLVRKLKDHS